jgi:hypothetical protein
MDKNSPLSEGLERWHRSRVQVQASRVTLAARVARAALVAPVPQTIHALLSDPWLLVAQLIHSLPSPQHLF